MLLHDALRPGIEVESLKRIAQRARVSVGGLWYHHPELCEQLIQLFREHRMKKAADEERASDILVRRHLERWDYVGEGKPTRKGLLRAMYDGEIAKRTLQRSIDAVLVELQLL